jgi:hypothetical protein
MTKSWEKYISKHPFKQELKEIIKDLSEKQFETYDIVKFQ